MFTKGTGAQGKFQNRVHKTKKNKIPELREQNVENKRSIKGSGNVRNTVQGAGCAEGSSGDAGEGDPEAGHDGDDTQPVAWKTVGEVA